ncbi:MAG: adenosylcobinamide-GDP ribazoletransferase [Clostridium sp.]|nr:adenosylcobinamide-GDP ribazoletransferase [Clostridium sp.]
MLEPVKIAFSMYSKIPMPEAKWDEKNMRYALCFFPFVGIVIGALFYLWFIISNSLGLNNILRSAVFTVIPILITGGIHVDGFVDTMDAVNSYQSKERKLEILKDSHIGAFALITCIVYFILNFGIVSEIRNFDSVFIIALGFVLSRSLSTMSIVKFQSAKNSGLARTFKDGAEKNTVKNVMIFYIILIAILMIYINAILGLGAFLSALSSFVYYKSMSYKNFGGITGDLAGFFLQICELMIMIVVVFLNILF